MKTCQRCGSAFKCLAGTTPFKCWCQELSVKTELPTQYSDCLCKECLESLAALQSQSDSSDLKEGQDFYLEKGLMVFTSQYHLDRGYCCNSGCRHCPYKG